MIHGQQNIKWKHEFKISQNAVFDELWAPPKYVIMYTSVFNYAVWTDMLCSEVDIIRCHEC
jgi:hypothetical protein